MKIPKGWRKLRTNATIKARDKFWHELTGKWYSRRLAVGRRYDPSSYALTIRKKS
jgi:hypothetical protein